MNYRPYLSSVSLKFCGFVFDDTLIIFVVYNFHMEAKVWNGWKKFRRLERDLNQ